MCRHATLAGRSRAILAAIAAAGVVCLPTLALGGSYTEDFTTTAYMDPANTTANWDTTAGVLKLFPFTPSIVGGYDTPERAWGLDIDGNTAFVADFLGGLQIIDITDVNSPVLLGAYDTPGHALDVKVDGDWAYLADDGPGLKVFDVTDLTNPIEVASWDPPSAVWGLFVSGNHLYVANHGGGLRVLDITDPTTPTEVGALALPGSNHRVTVDGDYAYVASLWAGGGLHVVDVTDPTNPVQLGTYDTPGDAREVAVSGDYAYVADNNAGLVVVDVSDPANPAFVWSYTTPSMATGIDVVGDRAYLAATDSGLYIFDITDPTSPTLLHSVATLYHARRVAVDGEHAFVADHAAGVQVVDIFDTLPPEIIGSVDTPGLSEGVVTSGDYAYVACSEGLQVIDIGDPTQPVLNGSAPVIGAAHAVSVAGDHAYVASTYGLVVIDIRDPDVPVMVGAAATPGWAMDVFVAGDHAYVAEGARGLRVIDISDPTVPVLVGLTATSILALGVVVAGDRAYVADEMGGLRVIDIEDPTAPFPVGSVPIPGSANDVAVAGNYAYVTSVSGFFIVDITLSQVAGTVNVVGLGLAVEGNNAYVATASGLTTIDISHPPSHIIVGSVATPTSARDVVVAGDRAYVVHHTGLQVVATAQSAFDSDRNEAESTDLLDSASVVPRARLTTSQVGSIHWQLSSGEAWQVLANDGAWARLYTGTLLRWRSIHFPAGLGVNPSCSELTLDWLHEFAPISTIADVSDDQGGWVRVQFARSGYDFADETSLPVTGYQLYRRVDESARCQQVVDGGTAPAPGDLISTPFAALRASRIRMLDGLYFVLGDTDAQRGTFPPGVWEAVTWIGATQSDSYLAAVPTVADSTESGGIAWSVCLTTTHTSNPTVWFASEPDSGYSVDNLAPMAPMNLVFDSPEILRWDTAGEGDFARHTVYGSYVSHLDENATLLGYTVEAVIDVSGTAYGFYHVTTSDHAGNVSEAGGITNPFVSAPEIDALPQVLAVRAASPNPARSMTSFALALPEASRVTATVFDAAGARVRSLRVGDRYPAGQHRVSWDGRDDGGHRVGTGIYFLRVSITGRSGSVYEQSRKVVWMR